jgi:hypothetical protein
MGVRASLLVAMAEGKTEAENMSNSTDAELSDESIQLRQNFRTLSAGNQLTLLEIAKVLNRLQQNG